jgi:hypothetical protein
MQRKWLLRNKTGKEDKMNYDLCPKCGNDNMEWGHFELQGGNDGYYEVSCRACGFSGRQWQMMEFDGWQRGPDKDGQYEDVLSYPEKETEANAKLIAAAPDLLEACKQIKDALEDGSILSEDKIENVIEDMHHILSTAIKKATE